MEKKILTSREFISSQLTETGKEILRYTPQLFRRKSENEPINTEPLASSILLKISNSRFLITSAHIFEDNNSKINASDVGVSIDNSFYILNGNIIYTDIKKSTTNDKVDLTIWRLDDNVADDLSKKYKFLQLTDLDINHDITNQSNYIIAGYPVSKTKKKLSQKKYLINPFLFNTRSASKKLYKKFNLEEHSHIILEYRKRKIVNVKSSKSTEGPDLYGISGSGAWFIPHWSLDGILKFKLVGIMNEWRREHNAIIATRIHIVTETIRQKFGLDIPQSSTTTVDLAKD